MSSGLLDKTAEGNTGGPKAGQMVKYESSGIDKQIGQELNIPVCVFWISWPIILHYRSIYFYSCYLLVKHRGK